MPDSRSIGTPRDSIGDRSTGTIGTTRNGFIRSSGIGRNRSVGSGITTAQASPIAQADIERIDALIRQNASRYIDLPSYAQTPVQTPTIIPGVTDTLPRNPFETLADAFLRGFGGATYNPPLQQQAYGYGTASGTNWTLILILGAIGIGVYYFYFRS